MIELDSASGTIQIPKVYDYQELMDKIKNILQIDEKLFQYLYFSYIDEKEQERIRINSQIFDEFIMQETPKLSIGFLENIDENTMEEFKELIEVNKKRFKEHNYIFDDEGISVRYKNVNLNKSKEEEKENIIQLEEDKDDILEEEENNNKQIIINNNIINIKSSENFKLLDSDNINLPNLNLINNLNSSNNINKKNSSNDFKLLENSDINIIKLESAHNENNHEENKIIIEDEFSKNIEDIISANIENIKDDIIHSIILEQSKIQQNSKMRKAPKNRYVHENYICNICEESPIKGIRYHCIECMDFDICEKCEAIINHPHPLYKIKNDKLCKFKNENYN